MAEKKIGDRTYRTELLPAKQALALYFDLMRVATKATGRLPALIAALIEEDENSPMASIATVAAIGDILKSTPSDEIVNLLERIVSACEVQRHTGFAPVDIDEEFHDNLAVIIPVCRFVITEQYRDFFIGSVGGGIICALKEALANKK